MKYIILILFATVSWSTAERVDTNSKLPKDSPIYLIDRPSKEQKITEVVAFFVSQEVVLSYTQGNWLRKVYLVTYKIIETNGKEQLKELSFIVTDSYATKESGIRLKKHHWPFRKKIPRTFLIKRDAGVKHKAYFNILWHDLVMVEQDAALDCQR